MSELKDSLYDLSDAIALSRRLTGETRPVPSGPPPSRPADSPYIRFSAGQKPAVEAIRAPAVPTPTPRTVIETAPLPTEPFHTWEEALKWCIEFSKARCGFIVDSQGFVMMTDGKDIPEDQFEGAGANLGGLFSDLNQMDNDSGSALFADLTYEKQAFLAIRIFDPNGEHCILGIVSDDINHSWPKQAVYQQIMKNLSALLL